MSGTVEHLGHTGRQPDRNLAGEGAAHATQFLACALDLMKNAAPVFQQQPAGLCGYGTPSVSGQQRLAQFHFEQPDLTAECGLGNVKCEGRACKAAEFCHTNEVVQLTKLHEFQSSDNTCRG